jgi:hypothetical protein
MICSAEGCPADAVSRGLCMKHHMRLRRTGDVNGRKSRKRPPSPELEAARKKTDKSPRTQAYMAQASRLLSTVGERDRKAAVAWSIRSNGSISVSRLNQIATPSRATRRCG